MSGMLCSNALRGYPARDAIIGVDFCPRRRSGAVHARRAAERQPQHRIDERRQEPGPDGERHVVNEGGPAPVAWNPW